MKKIVALLLICCMVLPMISASAAATEEPTPTIEEILNEYHAKAFEAQAAAENGGASTYARGGSSQTLEQETVDTLTVAGYEAYNVTGDNYDSVEETLNTDLATLGLDPNCSYVVVVSGQNPSSLSSPNARVADPPLYDDFDNDNGGGTNSFTYSYKGVTYTMRYITVTAQTAESELFVTQNYMVSNINYIGDIFKALADYMLTVASEKIAKKLAEEGVDLIPYVGDICSVVSLVADVYNVVTANPFTLLDPDTMVLFSATAWTQRYIQVYDTTRQVWKTAQCSSYAVSKAKFAAGYYYDPVTNSPQELEGILKDTTTYSPFYINDSLAKSRAVEGATKNYVAYDATGDIDFYLTNPDAGRDELKEILLFSHPDYMLQLIPIWEEE